MTGEKRTVTVEEVKGFEISELILVAVLIAAGAVLKMVVGNVINFFGMKPNFIIAAYCLAILLVKPKLYQAVIIGIITGAVCQFLPGTPYINFISEVLGALCMCIMIKIPMKINRLDLSPMVSTFVSTIISGGSFTVCLFVFMNADRSSMIAYVPIVFFTAVINMILVQMLYVPLKKVLKK